MAMKRCARCHGKLGLGVRSRNTSQRDKIVVAAHYRIPAIYEWREFITAGGPPRPRNRRATEQYDELAPFQTVELHSVPKRERQRQTCWSLRARPK
jgi:cytochrome c